MQSDENPKEHKRDLLSSRDTARISVVTHELLITASCGISACSSSTAVRTGERSLTWRSTPAGAAATPHSLVLYCMQHIKKY